VDLFSWLPCDGRGGVRPCFTEEADDFPCYSPFNGIFVAANGWVTYCCQDVYGQFPVGVFPAETIEEIWFGEKLNAVRKLHLARQKKNLPLCLTCHTYY
jgi:hypothetical protein